MTGRIDTRLAREAIACLPEGTSYGEIPAPEQVYLPSSHLKAMDPDTMLVTGMRGAGKTFWWAALQDAAVRELVYRPADQLPLRRAAKVATGFGIKPEPDRYPDKDVLNSLLSGNVESRILWRTVLVQQIAPDDHPIQREKSWHARVAYTAENPEAIAHLLRQMDDRLVDEGLFFVVLFDALDRCADDWRSMYKLIRGLMQVALDMRSYRRLRVKIFLRTDQVDENRIADFPDASKVLSSSVELGWPPRELFGLLWHNLVNGGTGEKFRHFLRADDWRPTTAVEQTLYHIPRTLISNEEFQREKFHDIAGPWMGRNAKRGFPYTWIPNHLADTKGQVSPRSFLEALRKAARDTAERYPDHQYPLHFESIKRGVQNASTIRVNEIREDYPWTHRTLDHLAGITVPCEFSDIEMRWRENRVLEQLAEDVEQDDVKLPPLHIREGAGGIRQDLQSLGIFLRLRDGRVNIPDVFRVGYGLGRKGGVRPAR